MTIGSHIRAVDGDETPREEGAQDDGIVDETLELSEEIPTLEEDEFERPFHKPRTGWLAPTLALLVIGGWTGLFAWSHYSEFLGGGTPQQWSDWIIAWSIPVLLVVAIWLLAMRTSSREAVRFADVANALSWESALLEERLVTINSELSLAREFLGAQARDLEYLGRSASERISEHADRLQSLVRDNGAQVDSIASVSNTALENMDKLRSNLPVIANSARDVSNQIGQAGRTAKGQLGELVTGFERLNEFGAASERQVASLRERVEETIAAFQEQAEHMGSITGPRFSALREESEAFRVELDAREVEALAAIRGRADALRIELNEIEQVHGEQRDAALSALDERISGLRGKAAEAASGVREAEEAALAAWAGQIEAMKERLQGVVAEISDIDARALEASNEKLHSLSDEAERVDERLIERDKAFQAKLAARRQDFDAAEQASLASLNERLAALDAEMAQRRDDHLAHVETFASHSEQVRAELSRMGESMDRIAARGQEAETNLRESAARLSGSLDTSGEALNATEQAIARLTDSSVRLLELIQASAKHSKADLPVAIEDFESRLGDVETRTETLRGVLNEASQSGTALSEIVVGAEERALSAIAGIDEFAGRFAGSMDEQGQALDDLSARLSALNDRNGEIARKVQAELREAIGLLEEKASAALAAIESDQAERIRAIADKVGAESAGAIGRAVEEHSTSAIAELQEATEKATGASREAAMQLRDQLAKVNELAGNLESRVARAREQAQEDVNSDFSRRVALITESLNSNSIDIGKALSTEVTDTAWTSYLRGDRGVFTRRAARLVGNTEAREIAELYDTDLDFREHVSRYIHDFEAMLRTMLSTRDGHAVSVTLLSSDMGKLYVALAQAIERLRE